MGYGMMSEYLLGDQGNGGGGGDDGGCSGCIWGVLLVAFMCFVGPEIFECLWGCVLVGGTLFFIVTIAWASWKCWHLALQYDITKPFIAPVNQAMKEINKNTYPLSYWRDGYWKLRSPKARAYDLDLEKAQTELDKCGLALSKAEKAAVLISYMESELRNKRNSDMSFLPYQQKTVEYIKKCKLKASNRIFPMRQYVNELRKKFYHLPPNKPKTQSPRNQFGTFTKICPDCRKDITIDRSSNEVTCPHCRSEFHLNWE